MKPQIIKSSILSLTVCVPATMTDAEVEAFANERSPLGWRVPPKADCRSPCDTSAGCVHIALDR